jgi:predicted alpha/beta-fold hydrolase
VRANPSLELELVATGGHVGFLEGSPWAPRFWADTAAARFLANALQASARSLK